METARAIDRLIKREGIGYQDTLHIFSDILRDEENPMQQGAFLAALTAKGATMDELSAVRDAILREDTIRTEIHTDRPLCDNCGSGMDTFRTFNISTVSAVTAACLGAAVARHGSRSVTSGCGTVDVCEKLGINVEASPSEVASSVERCGIGLFNGSSAVTHPRGLFRILSQVHFGTVLNNAASLASPASPDYGLRGVNSPELLAPMAELMISGGYKRAMTVLGRVDGSSLVMDEASTLGETLYAFVEEGKETVFGSIDPSSLGLEAGNAPDIAFSGDVSSEADRITAILSGKGKHSETDIVSLNTGMLLYVAGLAGSVTEGTEAAREKLKSGECINKLGEWKKAQSLTM